MALVEAFEDEPITEKDLIEFLNSKNVKGECEACGTNKWSLVTDIDPTASLGLPVMPFSKGSAINSSGLNICATICDNCSNTRIYWRYAICIWRKQKREARGAE